MNNYEKQIYLIVLAIFVSIFYFACQSNDTPISIECETCKQQVPNEVLKLKIGAEGALDYDLYYNDDGNFGIPSYSLAVLHKSFSSKELSSLHEKIDPNVLDTFQGDELVSLVYFAKTTSDKTISLTKENLLGYLVYLRKDNKLYCHPHILQPNGLGEHSLDGEVYVYAISSNDFATVSKYLNHWHSIGVTTVVALNMPRLGNPDGRAQTLTSIFEQNYGQLNLEKKAPKPGCPAPCAYVDTRTHCIAQESQGRGEVWSCYHNPCPKDVVDQVLSDNSVNNTFADNSILYEFRDWSLLDSGLGADLRQDYYTLSDYISSDDISLALAIEAMNVGTLTIKPLIEDLMANPNSTSTLYGNTERDIMLNFVDDVMQLSNDPEFISIMNNTKSLIITFANQTNAYITASFN